MHSLAVRQSSWASSSPALVGLWLLVATGSIVAVEPAPYDVLGFGICLLFFALGLRLPAGVGAPLFLLGIYLLGNVVAAIFSDHPADTIKPLWVRTFLVLTWLLFVCMIYPEPRRHLRLVWNAYLVAAAVAVFSGFAAYWGLLPGLSDLALEHGRVRGTFKDPNVYGPFLVPAALYAMMRVEYASGLQRLFYLAFFLLVAVGLLLSFSRGAWIDFGVAALVYLLLRLATERSLRNKARLLALTGVLFFAAVATVAVAVTATKAGALFFARAVIAQDYDLDPNEGRLSVQRDALEAAAVTPLGVGPSQSALLLGIPPHNLYLHVLVEAGWLGALGFWAFVAVTLVRGLSMCLRDAQIQPESLVVFACLVGLLVQSLFIDATHWRHFFLLLGMLWALILAWQRRRPTR